MEILSFMYENTLMMVFLILMLGFVVGRIQIMGFELGDAGILLVALLFGHLGIEIPSIIKDLGLICFVTSVGFIAGPNFFRNFRRYASSYIILGIVIILSGALVCALEIFVFNVPVDLCLGMLSGALTSTPGLAASIEATSSEVASIGYGIAYPFGVIGVVLFVQIMPKLLKINIPEERKRYISSSTTRIIKQDKNYFSMDVIGLFSFSFAVFVGLLIASIKIPLPGGASFSLGTSGGPLISGLIFGYFGHIAMVDLKIETHNLIQLREFGLVLFLLGAGTAAGSGLVDIIREYGFVLFIYGALMTLVPLVIGYFFAYKVIKLSIFDALGAICGGMTSTPALGSLIGVTGTDNVASAYAATYPIALVMVVLVCQFISLIFL